MMAYPKEVTHFINGSHAAPRQGKFFDKIDPASGEIIASVAAGTVDDASLAVSVAVSAFPEWSALSVDERRTMLGGLVSLMKQQHEALAVLVAKECGKSIKNSLAEVNAAIACGEYFVSEHASFNDVPLTSTVPSRTLFLRRRPVGAGVLIVPFNNPSASIAWKLFPALLCGNTVVVKSHEETPAVAVWYAERCAEAGIPPGVVSVLQGRGAEVGSALVEDPRVSFVSLTGSVKTGASIIRATADRLAKVSIEAGGKNPLVVCADANIENAVSCALSSSFVDGGQRCAAASRIIIEEGVYDEFTKRFLARVASLSVGVNDDDAYGAIISEKRMNEILDHVVQAEREGVVVLCGGKRINRNGFFIEPTVLEGALPQHLISTTEVFGPVVALYRVANLDEAIMLANATPFGLSSAIHTADSEKARYFITRYEGGVVRVNGPTHGSEPHVPFGGTKHSGNGWREPGVLALDFYSEWQQVSIDNV